MSNSSGQDTKTGQLPDDNQSCITSPPAHRADFTLQTIRKTQHEIAPSITCHWRRCTSTVSRPRRCDIPGSRSEDPGNCRWTLRSHWSRQPAWGQSGHRSTRPADLWFCEPEWRQRCLPFPAPSECLGLHKGRLLVSLRLKLSNWL